MIYLAESGSTKCDALFLTNSGEEVVRFKTMGFNPYFHSANLIHKELSKVSEVQQYAGQVDHVFFYGAGCSAPQLNAIVEKGLGRVFKNAQVRVNHDLVAAGYSTYTGEPAITCILGTGSNSVYFDGENIREEVPALAFILGDEGSASYFGKRVVADYLYKKMPEAAREDFYQTYKLTKDEIIDRVYNQPGANVFLADFAPFVSKHIDSPYFQEIVHQGFRAFIETHVLCYPEAAQVPVHFVGSVAYHLSDILMAEVERAELRAGNIVQKPLKGLIEYHRKHLWPEASAYKAS